MTHAPLLPYPQAKARLAFQRFNLQSFNVQFFKGEAQRRDQKHVTLQSHHGLWLCLGPLSILPSTCPRIINDLHWNKIYGQVGFPMNPDALRHPRFQNSLLIVYVMGRNFPELSLTSVAHKRFLIIG